MSSERTANNTADLSADVVVVGSGGGLAAAVTAAEKGARVILLEKENVLGGYTRQANGFMACASPVQKRQNITVSTDEVFRVFMNWTHCRRVDPRIVRAYIDKTGDTIRWLEEKGLEFELMRPSGTLPIGHMAKEMGAGVQKALIKSCEELGVEVRLLTSGRKILTEADGSVAGVEAVTEGKAYPIRAKSVIVATGGFGDSKELLRKYCPDYHDGMYTDIWPHHKAHSGDGLLMAQEIGAAIADTVPIHAQGPYYHPFLYPWQSIGAVAAHRYTVWVNKRGRRFIDEGGSLGPGESWNAINLQPDKMSYTIFDDSIRKIVEEGLPGAPASSQKHAKRGGGTMIAGGTFPGLAEDLRKEAAKTGGIKIADSWDEIADWMGAAPEVLEAEIAEYNTYCQQGRDAVFAKDKASLLPLSQPPYYAMRCAVRAGETLGGIKVNERMEMLNNEGRTIPGAYVAGVLADGFEPEDYCREVAGTAMGFAINSGRIAGENAAEYARKQ